MLTEVTEQWWSSWSETTWSLTLTFRETKAIYLISTWISYNLMSTCISWGVENMYQITKDTFRVLYD